MKTKIFTLIAGIMVTASAFACGDSTECKKHTYNKDGFHFWEGIDIGVNGYVNGASNTLETPSGYSFFELDYARSHSFGLNLGQYNLHLYRNYIYVVTGLGLEFNSYAIRNNVTLLQDAPVLSAVNESVDFSKNKLKTTWITAPVLLEFNTSKKEENSFHVGIGANFGYNIFRNRLKQEFNLDGEDVKRVRKDDYNINPFRYGATVRVGFGNYTLFANYAFSEMFKEGRGPKVYPFSAGVHLDF